MLPFFRLEGSLCEYRSVGSHNPDDFDTFVQYRDTALERVCDPPEQSATVTWTPDNNTPNLVFYQVCRTFKACYSCYVIKRHRSEKGELMTVCLNLRAARVQSIFSMHLESSQRCHICAVVSRLHHFHNKSLNNLFSEPLVKKNECA